MSKLNLAELRKEYCNGILTEQSVNPDPIQQFKSWFSEAQNAAVNEPNAMCLSTVNKDGRPSSRIVLLKDIEEGGFVFFTNYDSRKSRELSVSGYAALNFCWLELERQVRIEGKCKRVSAALSDQYFSSRPLGSRLGAWASPQSSVIPNREFLEERLQQVSQEMEGQDPARPEFWGGFVVIPDRIEFWQGRPSRLHDRIEYLLEGNSWTLRRLAP